MTCIYNALIAWVVVWINKITWVHHGNDSHTEVHTKCVNINKTKEGQVYQTKASWKPPPNCNQQEQNKILDIIPTNNYKLEDNIQQTAPAQIWKKIVQVLHVLTIDGFKKRLRKGNLHVNIYCCKYVFNVFHKKVVSLT